jgi:lipopolysaccharide/colanic/teichoic acid biosynthesis glycosyltransferase
MASFFAPEETQITVERLDGIPLLNFSATPENTVGLAVKGLFDFVLAAVLAVVLSPLLVAIAGAVRLSSPGPILSRLEALWAARPGVHHLQVSHQGGRGGRGAGNPRAPAE